MAISNSGIQPTYKEKIDRTGVRFHGHKTIFIPNKPSTAAGTVDSDGTQTYQWVVPLNECGVVASVDNTDPTKVFTKYDLYLNANRIVSK